MPNIAVALKAEISRIARKEIRTELTSLQKSQAAHRKQIAALRRQVDALEGALKKSVRAGLAKQTKKEDSAEESNKVRFSAKGFASHRARLGLSAAQLAAILGVSALSVYKWESGKTRPRDRQLEAIAEVRKMGRREALARLEALTQEPTTKRGRRTAAK